MNNQLVKKLKKDQLLRYVLGKCSHRHSYNSHPQCFIQDQGLEEKVGFIDIETMTLNFKANHGVVLSYCIKHWGGPILEDTIAHKDLKNPEIRDANIIKNCVRDMNRFDRLVVYYGGDRRFDIPTLRTRALHHGLPFPELKDIKLTDVYSWVRNKLNLNSNSLKIACKTLGIPAKDHAFDVEMWFSAFLGDKEAMHHVLEHNREDVISLELLYERLIGMVNEGNISI